MKFTEETVKAAAFTLSAFCSSQECGTCPFGGTDGNAEIPCLFKSAEPATWFPMALEMNEPALHLKRRIQGLRASERKGFRKDE